ncbi:hypothetical protein NDU88_006165 [Pleurodeles waltl]|uniref:Uncharacterized protein n=1 Tax=Pleurodeles waltl TaxID=8319 RepID=A0AAV7TYR1_PLEWA|nr:hypothetical protein NDU88_006165 [Pleurodeles waltl]
MCTIAGSGHSSSPPCSKSARGVEDSTRPARSPTTAPNSPAPAMLRLSPGLLGRHRQARPRRSRPQDKQ